MNPPSPPSTKAPEAKPNVLGLTPHSRAEPHSYLLLELPRPGQICLWLGNGTQLANVGAKIKAGHGGGRARLKQISWRASLQTVLRAGVPGLTVAPAPNKKPTSNCALGWGAGQILLGDARALRRRDGGIHASWRGCYKPTCTLQPHRP